MGEVVPVGVEEAEAVVAMEDGVAGAVEVSDAAEEMEMVGGPGEPLDLAAGWDVGGGLLVCCCWGCWAAGW